jgi:hypothetical protein
MGEELRRRAEMAEGWWRAVLEIVGVRCPLARIDVIVMLGGVHIT